MKKILVILFASLFLIGCQSNDKPEDDQIAEDNDVEQVDETEDVDETDQDDGEDLSETDGSSDDGSVDEEEPTEPEASEDDETEANGGSTGYSPDDAILLVQEFIQGTGSDIGLNYSVDGTDDQGNYRIQVFEVVDHGDGETHTATYGWYLVDPETGEITDLFAE